jgi:outer membrane protein assembly factor BamB
VLLRAALALAVGFAIGVTIARHDRGSRSHAGPATTTTVAAPTSASAAIHTNSTPSIGATTTSVELADPTAFGAPYGTTVRGLFTFRGNPSRSYMGEGPVPHSIAIHWRFPDHSMCSSSAEFDTSAIWCGTGWTGEPAVFERGGHTWVVFGAYDRAVHFLDADTGRRLLPDFPTGDIIKGSVTLDPDGYPLLYFGSRDNKLRVLAIDGSQATELWSLDAYAVHPVEWNDDWDGSPIELRDLLIEGGENSQFHVIRLNRSYDATGRVRVAPQLIFHTPGWDTELLRAIHDNDVSIENSVAVWNNIVYFANSGGLVQGWDLAPLLRGDGLPTRIFRFWTGDDTDASIVVDRAGDLYVGSEYERDLPRARAVGQLMKLDPRRANPIVWSVHTRLTTEGGTWSTPAVVGDTVIWPTRPGTVYGLDAASGAVRWQTNLNPPLMGSPVVVDGVWLQGDCSGKLNAFDVRDLHSPPVPLWSQSLIGCVESTPAVWHGSIYVGSRAGYFFALRAPPAAVLPPASS